MSNIIHSLSRRSERWELTLLLCLLIASILYEGDILIKVTGDKGLSQSGYHGLQALGDSISLLRCHCLEDKYGSISRCDGEAARLLPFTTLGVGIPGLLDNFYVYSIVAYCRRGSWDRGGLKSLGMVGLCVLR